MRVRKLYISPITTTDAHISVLYPAAKRVIFILSFLTPMGTDSVVSGMLVEANQ